MKYKNTKEFFGALWDLHNHKDWILMTRHKKLSERFIEKVETIPFYKTLSFWKKIITLLQILGIGIIIGVVLITLGHEKDNIIGLFSILILIEVIYLLNGGWKPNYQNEAFYRREMINKSIAGELVEYMAVMNQEKDDIIKEREEVNNLKGVADIDKIKFKLKGSATTHPIDYMLNDALLEYWDDSEKPHLLAKKDRTISEFDSLINQLKKEIEFCKKIE